MTGNDPERFASDEEPETVECRHCDRQTHEPDGICPDCQHEGDETDARYRNPPTYRGVEATPGMEEDRDVE